MYHVWVRRISTGENFPWQFSVRDAKGYWSETGFAMTRWGAKLRAKRAIRKHRKGDYCESLYEVR